MVSARLRNAVSDETGLLTKRILGRPDSSPPPVEEMFVSEPIEDLLTVEFAGSIFGHDRTSIAVEQERKKKKKRKKTFAPPQLSVSTKRLCFRILYFQPKPKDIRIIPEGSLLCMQSAK